ncbi:hypothetical protein AB2T48_06820 [Clostridium butyricum]|uniref:hypothetical protein n=1 Tax=Clostridium butyricum TaxID=1492 RepID=UPI0034653A01
MKQIIYSKYSNERDTKFQIRTDILKNENKDRYVHKIALNTESIKHIDNINNSYLLLTELYKDSKINVPKCTRIDNGVELEYITGKTLSEQLDELFFRENYAELVEKIKEYSEIIAGYNIKKFKITDKFMGVFGNVQLPTNLLSAADINNIDLIFDNIIINDKWNIIDYEWTFNFLIPINFIIYRAIKIYIDGSQKRNELRSLGIYKLLGITNEEISAYNRMEENFQRYVSGEWVSLNKLYGQTTDVNINVSEIIQHEKNNMNKNSIQVFYDYGEGYSEENSYRFSPLCDSSGNIEFEINITSRVKSIRVDPCNDSSIVNIISISRFDEKYHNIEYATNGINISDNLILYDHNDPQIVLNSIKDGTTKIQLNLYIQILSKHLIIEICKSLDKKDRCIEEKDRCIEEKDRCIEEKDRCIEEKDRCIEERDGCIEEKDRCIEEKDRCIEEKDRCIEEKDRLIQEIMNSKGWKAIQRIKRFTGK